jgi:hypothetical protein
MNAPLQSQTCTRCGTAWSGTDPNPLCSDCIAADLFTTVPVENREAADAFIYARQSLKAILELKESIGLSLGDATTVFYWRAEQLRTMYPERFEQS